MWLKGMTALCAAVLFAGCSINAVLDDKAPAAVERPTLAVQKVDEDFEVDGKGTASQWEKAEWTDLQPIHGSAKYSTRFKTLYSDKGIYFLFDCEDTLLTSTITEHYGALYSEDVVEVFLWTEESQRVYFEYEISPLNYELPIMVVKSNGTFQGWRPWNYEGERKIRRATAIRGGEMKSEAEVEGWSTEFFIPFQLLRGLRNLPPVSGTLWRANMYRIDYDEPATFWVWSHLDAPNFHMIDHLYYYLRSLAYLVQEIVRGNVGAGCPPKAKVPKGT